MYLKYIFSVSCATTVNFHMQANLLKYVNSLINPKNHKQKLNEMECLGYAVCNKFFSLYLLRIL
jgi:hypothetical protein